MKCTFNTKGPQVKKHDILSFAETAAQDCQIQIRVPLPPGPLAVSGLTVHTCTKMHASCLCCGNTTCTVHVHWQYVIQCTRRWPFWLYLQHWALSPGLGLLFKFKLGQVHIHFKNTRCEWLKASRALCTCLLLNANALGQTQWCRR